MSDLIDALVYTSIKNNLNSSNYKAYNLLKNKINISSNDDINNLLSNTTIKKACCAAQKKRGSDDVYQTKIPILDPSGNSAYVLKTIDVPKSICDTNSVISNSDDCNSFKMIYCENNNYLFQNSPKLDTYADYSPFCADYKLLVPPLTPDELAKIEADKKAQQQLEDNAIKNALQKNNTANQDSTNSTDSTDSTNSKNSTNSTNSSNTTLIIACVCIMMLCCSSVIGAYFMMQSKKSKK